MDGVELTWPGKRREPPTLAPRRFVERERHGADVTNRLIQGDAVAVLASLAPLPPCTHGGRGVGVRGEVARTKEEATPLRPALFPSPPTPRPRSTEGEGGGVVDLVAIDPPFATGRDFTAYTDRLPPADYLQLLRDVFLLSHRLLAPTGSLYVHLDYRAAPFARLLLDEVFGADHLQNEIIWSYATGGRTRKAFPAKHDTILAYRRGDLPYFDAAAVGVVRGDVRRNHMKRHIDESGRAYRTIRSAGKEYRYYDDERVLPPDVWADIAHLQQKDPERTGYPTQKPERLLERILLASCPPGGLVVDCFCGSGTTAAVAQQTGRRWLASDMGDEAITTTRGRLLGLGGSFVVAALEV